MDSNQKPAAPQRVSRWKLYFTLLVIVFLASIFASLNMGFNLIPFQDVFQIVLKNIPGLGNFVHLTPYQDGVQNIVILVRLPRILAGALVGAALAAGGAIFQGMFRNPMADPYTTSASSAASLGAAIAIVLGFGVATFGVYTIPLFAFVGSFSSVLLVYFMARVGSRVPISTLLLTGIAVSILELAFVTYLQTIASNRLPDLTFWLIGSLSSSRITLTYVLALSPLLIFGVIAAFLYSRDLNIIALGEDQAQHLGVNLERLKFALLLIGALLTATAVSISGPVAFIGLMIPNLTRLIVGPDHKVLITASVLFGATFLVLCDGFVRFLTSQTSPQEVPVGVVTALVGGVFFLFLLRRKRRIDAF